MGTCSAALGLSETTRKKEKNMLIFPCETRVQGHVCKLNCQSALANSHVSEMSSCVHEHCTNRGSHPKNSPTHSYEWEAERHLTSLCRQTLVYSSASRIKQSDFNSIFRNSAKPMCPGYSGYGIVFLKTAGFIICNTENRCWFKTNLI